MLYTARPRRWRLAGMLQEEAIKALQHGSAAVFVSNDREKPMEIEPEGSANDIFAVWKPGCIEFRLPKAEAAAPQGNAFSAMMSARQPAANTHVQPQSSLRNLRLILLR